MNASYVHDRVRLWRLRRSYPDWTLRQLAEAVQRSLTWVKKWLRRFRQEPPDMHPAVFFGRSCAPHRPYRKVTPEVRNRILAIRDNPPDGLRRRPGPKTILYFLHRQPDLPAEALPTSTRTIWQVLVEAGRIPRPRPMRHQPIERPAPDAVWAMDFKDISTVRGDPEETGKRQHWVEALTLIDEGTSRYTDVHVRADFRMATTIVALASTFLLRGLPQAVRMDRDPRFIGSWTAQDFPSALMKFLMCLGIGVQVVPPRRPDKNPFVERLHRTLQEEVLQPLRPGTVQQAREALEAFRDHYNHQRPNQALSCGNRPPMVAFPEQPRPTVPEEVDPDAWLSALERTTYTRRVSRSGSIDLGGHSYYVQQRLAGQKIVVVVEPAHQRLALMHDQKVLKRKPLKGLHQGNLPFDAFLRLMVQQAHTEDRRLTYRRR